MPFSIFIVYFISVVSTLLLGSFVFFQNPKEKINKTFGSFILSILGWQISLFLFYQVSDPLSVYWFGKINFVFAELLALSLFFLCYFFPKVHIRVEKEYLMIATIITFLLASVTLFTPFVVQSEIITGVRERTTVFGFLYSFFVLHFVLFTIGGIALLFIKFKKLTGLYKLQTQYLLLGFFIGITIGTITNIVFPLIFKVYIFQQFGLIAPLIFVLFTSYAIVKHRLLDVQLLVTRTISYSFLLLILGGVFSTGLFVAGRHLFGTNDIGQNIFFSTILALLLAYLFQPLRNILENVTDKFFYKGQYKLQEVLSKLNKTLVSTYLVKDLLNNIVTLITSEIKVSNCQIFLMDDDRIRLYVSKGLSLPKTPLSGAELSTIIKQIGHQKLLFENIGENHLKSLMRTSNTKAIFPLRTKDNFIGLLLVGDKLSGGILRDQDIKLLELFTPELSLAIQNAEAFDEISNFNLTLKDEVERATEKLKAANERLKELDQVKDEFVSIASHELRTPLTSIRNYQWMLLNNKGGKLTEKQRYYTERSYQSTNRLTKLVTDMLNVSRIDSGRLLLDVSKLQLPEMTKDILVELHEKIKEKNIKIIHQHTGEKSLPAVLADADKIKEVIINLIYNALKFTPEKGKIEISYKHEKALVKMMIKDTGIGIDKTYLPSLFTKFGFVKDSLQSNHPSTESTGLGLYISKSIVELHGGKIWAESEGLNQGTTFIFTLPVYSEEQYQLLHKRYKKEKDAGLLHNSIS